MARMNYSFMVPSLLVLIVLIGYYFFRPRLPIRLNRAFLAVLVIDICTEVFEVIASRLNETWPEHAPLLLWVFNLLFIVFFLSRSYMFFVFTASVLDARIVMRSPLHTYVPVIYFPCVAIALSTPFTHWMFNIRQGYHSGPLEFVIYLCGGCYVLFSVWPLLRHRKEITAHEFISLMALQVILTAGYFTRFLLPTYIVMNTFCLMAILVIFLSFINPDLFLSERGYIYNLPAFKALLAESVRRRRPCRILCFALQNYNEHREIFGGPQMDRAMNGINRYLVETFPQMSAFYLQNGFYALIGLNRPDLDKIAAALRSRFTEPWETDSGSLRISVAFVEADTEILDCPADKLINSLLICQEELDKASETDASRLLSDSINEINQKLDIRRCLEKALERDDLDVYLQPIINSADGKRIAAEALVRLHNEKGEVIRPDLFISLAEREGYIVQLGEQVLTKVCRFIRDNDMKALGIRWINVNLSPVQFMSQNIPERFREILRQHGVSTDQIHLEITEQSMIDFSLMREQIEGLHKGGFEFALDDYGSGYSNLTRVRQYPFTNIKIDMEVVRNYFRDRDPLLPALIQAFKKLNFSITAEGIETSEMAEALRSIGCDYLQGYCFSRPLPMAEFLAL